MAWYTSLGLDFLVQKKEQFEKNKFCIVWKWIVKLEKRSG